MTKKQLFKFIGALALILLLVWGILYAWNRRLLRRTAPAASPSAQGAPVTNHTGIKPPTLPSAPVSLTPGIQTYTGILTLTTSVAQLKIGAQTYTLVTNPQSNVVSILTQRGFANGDKVSAMGKVLANQLIMTGISALAQ